MKTNSRTRSAYVTVHGGVVPTAPRLWMITTAEVFSWVCDNQGITEVENLSDAHYHSLWNMAELTAERLNELFTVSPRAAWLDRIAEIQNKPTTTAWAIMTPWLTQIGRAHV